MGQHRKHCTKNGTLNKERNNREVYQKIAKTPCGRPEVGTQAPVCCWDK
jgi:hypothetical protein